MEKCETCKHWLGMKNSPSGTCYLHCGRGPSDPEDAGERNLVTSEDCSVFTGKDFGCTLWEKKE